MENTIKFLSLDKSCRFSVLNHAKLKEVKELQKVKSNELKNFAYQLLTGTILLSAINSHSDKISFSFRFSEKNNIFCEINQNTFFFSISETLKKTDCSLDSLITQKAIMSVTKGDWHTGLHTSSVLIPNKHPVTILTHYTNQSEQLNVVFVFNQQYPEISILIQPLPFATKNQLASLTTDLSNFLNNEKTDNWHDLISQMTHLGMIIEKNDFCFN